MSYPGLWAAPAASYCPSRAEELPKQNMTKSHKQWDGKLCRNSTTRPPDGNHLIIINHISLLFQSLRAGSRGHRLSQLWTLFSKTRFTNVAKWTLQRSSWPCESKSEETKLSLWHYIDTFPCIMIASKYGFGLK